MTFPPLTSWISKDPLFFREWMSRSLPYQPSFDFVAAELERSWNVVVTWLMRS